MRPAVLLLALVALSACTWETYQDQQGKTGLRQRYAPGTPVVYQDGTFPRARACYPRATPTQCAAHHLERRQRARSAKQPLISAV